MSEKYKYYKVTGGAVKAAYDRWLAERTRQAEERNKIVAEFGASGTYSSTNEIVGLVYSDEKRVPEGWKNYPGQPTVWRPVGQKKEAKLIRERFRNAKLVSSEEFQAEVLGGSDPFRFMDGVVIRFIIFEWIGDIFILKVPHIEDPRFEGQEVWNPPDEHCIPLKMSEYWQLKESLEEKAA